MSLVDQIKQQAAKSGSNKGKFMYFKSGSKVRVRFLDNMDDGRAIKFHDSYAAGINVPCQEYFGRNCPYCDEDDIRTRDQYAWSVWDYESKDVKILMAPVNQCSPIPPLVALYDTYGTLTDRDYVITKSGQQQSTSYAVVPMDKAKFKNDKAKPFSESAFKKILDKAFPCDVSSNDDIDDDDDDDDETPKTKSKAKAKAKPEPEPVEDDDDDDDDWADEEEAIDYKSMSAKELYKLCKERGIDVKPKKAEKYYINLLTEYDSENEEDEDDDEWDD